MAKIVLILFLVIMPIKTQNGMLNESILLSNYSGTSVE